ncbi:MAG: isoamylase early set domain-containing protein [Acidimicrobiales bacterium]
MLQKQQLDGDTIVVSFRLPIDVVADKAFVVGDFNEWSTSSHAMSRSDGAFEVSLPLQVGHAYRFRYLLDGERWENDWAADSYVPNDFGGDDSVIDLRDGPDPTSAATAPNPAAKRTRAR